VIIGGTSGIGLATAAMAAEAGARITVAGRDPDRLAAALDVLGNSARGVTLDVANERGAEDDRRLDRDQRDTMIAAQTKRIPLGRIAQPEEIAHAIVFLMSNDDITGSTLTVDGGVSIA
jgi:NAD(P)-dependent dehydrogenase (short-subunit alcohol dehydrogenase family)